ncbi:MAG: glycerol kinase GlpK [Vicinamibacteria bacterium]|nr:glycerol kinase GlpK [Vicinamibacteria bacterium]
MNRGVLAIDQGTTGTTALVVGEDGHVLSRGYAELASSFPRPGWVTQSPEAIWESALLAVSEARARAPEVELAAIGITNQRETTVVWEADGGRPVADAIVWQSRQTAPLCEAMRADGREPMLKARTGLLLDPYFSATKLRFILDADDLQARAERGALRFGTVDSWLLWRLTGGAVHATDPTNASRTLLFDLRERRFAPDLLELFRVPAAVLPEVRSSAGPFGVTRGVPGLADGLPITGIAGDQQAALFGQGCTTAGQAKNTYGTGCFLLLHTGSAPPAASRGLLGTVCCDGAGGPAYGLEGSVFVAGAAVRWLRDQLGLIATAADSASVAALVPDTQGVHVVPAFSGLGTPYWDADARGAILGLTQGAGRAEIVRATLESIAFQTRDVVEAMNAHAAHPLELLRVDGGAATNDFLMQFQADILGVPVDRPLVIESTGLGAAWLAGLGGGMWSAGELAGLRQADRVFEPRLGADERETRYAAWREAVARVLTGAGPG